VFGDTVISVVVVRCCGGGKVIAGDRGRDVGEGDGSKEGFVGGKAEFVVSGCTKKNSTKL
jgi:hypothetical protein